MLGTPSKLERLLAKAKGAALLLLLIAALHPATTRAQVTFAGTQISVGGSTLALPAGIAADGKGNLYIADRVNNVLLSVPAIPGGFGAPATILSGLSGPVGSASDWSGNVFVADAGNNRIVMLPQTGGSFAAPVALGSGLSNPSGVAVDSTGNLYIADTGNNRIVELPRIGNSYGSSVLIGSGYSSPTGIAVDAADNLYIADTGNNRVVKQPFSAAGYGTQQVITKSVNAPASVAVDKTGNLYIADTGNSRIIENPWNSGARRYNSPVIVGSDFTTPQAVAVDWNGNLFVADSGKSMVMEVLSTSISFPSVAVNATSSLETYSFRIGSGTTIGSVGIYAQGVAGKDFADASSSTCTPGTYNSDTLCGVNILFTPLGTGQRTGAVVLYDGEGDALATAYLAGIGLQPQAGFLPGTITQLGSQLSGPSGVAVDGSGNVYIADTGNNRVVEIPLTGGAYGPQTQMSVTGLSSPMGITLDGAGNLYIVSNGNDKVLKLPWTGSNFAPQIKVGNGFYGPSGITVDAGGNVYITDTLDNGLDKLPWTGSGYTQAQPLGNYRKFPVGVAVDTVGSVYFSMPYQNALYKIPWSGSQYLTQLAIPMNGVTFPSAIAVDANSNLYILDSGNNRVVMLPWNGTSFASQITVAVGFNAPSGLAIDSLGNLYVADTGNNQIVKIDLSAPGTMTFANTYLGSTSSDSAQIATVENLGNQPLLLTSVNYPADFPEQSGVNSACSVSTSISQGSTCHLPINFTPTAADSPLNEQVAVIMDAATMNVTQKSFAVSGTGLGKTVQTISAPVMADVTYGTPPLILAATASSGLPVTYTVLSGPATLNYTGQLLILNGVGVVTVQADQTGNGAYAPATPITFSFTVNPAVLTVTPSNVTAVYGAIPAVFSYSVTGLVLGQTASQIVSGKPMITFGADSNCGSGIYKLQATQGTLSATNYTFSFAPATFTVTKALLRVQANPVTIMYGAAMPQLSWIISGFLNGDTASAIEGMPKMSSTASATSRVGSYLVVPTQGSLFAANYSFAFETATLRITAALLTVTADSLSMVYGGVVPAFTYNISGFVQGDSASSAIIGSPSFATTLSSRSTAGSYIIAPTLGTLKSANYNFQFVSGTMTVEKAVLTVTPTSAEIVYGDKLPTLNYSIAGFVNGDTREFAVTGTPALITLASPATKPGIYTVSAALGTLQAGNYSFEFSTGSITIDKAMVTVRPVPASMVYGSRVPFIAYQLIGFLNGDSARAIHGVPSFITKATSASPVGSYEVVGASGSLASDRYEFTFLGGTLTITKAALIVQVAPASKSYGSPLPAFTYSLVGLVNGDAADVVSGSPIFNTNCTSASPVGIYRVNATVGSLYSANYSFAINGGKLVVNPATLTLTPKPVTMTYGGSMASLTYSVAGLVNGDKSSVIRGTPLYTGMISKATPVGTYTFQMKAGSLTAANYCVVLQGGTATVTKAVLSVSMRAASMTYGSSLPTFVPIIQGFVNGEAANVVSGEPLFTSGATRKSAVGSYPVQASIGTLEAANYSFSFVTGQMTILPASLTVTANNLSVKSGASLPTLTDTISGFVNGDTAATAIKGTAALITTATRTSKAGKYPIGVSAGTMSAANYMFNFVKGTLTVTQ
jgi:sugar lactone lactonase YvrE